MPWERSWMVRRLDRVVLPLEDGPEIRMIRTCGQSAGDLPGNLGDILFVQGFGNEDDLMDAPGDDGVIQRTDIPDTQPV